jgi:hypothetical protein
MENRHGLPIAGQITAATKQGEWEAALEMVKQVTNSQRRITLGADTAYDEAGLVPSLRRMRVTPHVAQYECRRSNVDARTTRHEGYRISLTKRKRIETDLRLAKNYSHDAQGPPSGTRTGSMDVHPGSVSLQSAPHGDTTSCLPVTSGRSVPKRYETGHWSGPQK